MPPQGLKVNKYRTKRGVTAPQARNFAFLGHKSAKISFLFIRFLFTRRLAQHSFNFFSGGGGANDMLAPLPGFLGGMAGLPPPWIRQCCEANKKTKQMP